tara:strand:- start:512 stop:1537 length:1026 start_codon:yes stop_codon:yes gene_type:complete
MVNLSVDERFNLVKRNTEEIIGEEDLKKLIKEKKKPVAYLGTAPTGRPHVGYFIWGLKVADLLKAGFHVKILIADLHAALDNTPWNLLEHRYDYYAEIIPLMIQAMGADISELEFVKGSELQLKPEYMYDILKMSSNVSVRDSTRAAAEVVKMGDNPKLSGLIYPMMQAVDEQYLEVDMQIGGTDQRKIMVMAREQLPKIGYNPRIELMFPLLPGLVGKKMSSSNVKTKIDLLDDEKAVKDKLKGADCVSGDPDNGVMAFLKHVLMVINEDKKEKFTIKRDEKYGGNLEYENYSEIEKDFVSKKIHPLDLKNAVADEISELLKPINKKRKELEKISKLGYP